MRSARLFIPVFVFVSSIALIASPAHGQGWMDRIKQKAKEKVQQRTDQVTDSVTDAAVNGTEKAVKCVIGNLACIRSAEAASQQVAIVNANGKPVSTADSARAITTAASLTATSAPAASSSPDTEGAAVNVNQDFTPGTRIIWATDFASDPVGDFPRRLELKQGNFETASWNGKHLLRTTSGGDVVVPLPEVLPAQFTLEFDYTGATGWSTTERFSDDMSLADVEFSTSGDAEIYSGSSSVRATSNIGDLGGQLIHCQVMADGNYVKVYINGKRAAQMPIANLGRSKKIIFTLAADSESPAYLGNIRIAAGGKNMYEALTSDGRFTTHDIMFATGSAALDPRSTATLAEIGKMLQQHSDLRIEIDGHTDNAGSAAANQTLSDQRAAAVRTYLISNFQVDGSHLASKGFGASKPVASNNTPDGRQQNRRVELVKM